MPLELALLDDESDATKTVSRLETLAAQGVVAYLGGFGSDPHAAAASGAEKNKTPYLGVALALHKNHQQGFRHLFSPLWKSPHIRQATADLLASIPQPAGLVEDPRQGRRLCRAGAGLAPRNQGVWSEGAERGAREKDRPPRRSDRRPRLRVRADPRQRDRPGRLARPRPDP